MPAEAQPQFLIWSEEHAAWWRGGSAGYTRSIFDAGHYSFKEAMEITSDANKTGQTNEVALFAIVLTESFDGSKTRQDAPGSL
jgi:hypothetical protein